MNRVLVISPHPDDETLGCGGTILKHMAAGDNVSWLIITSILPEEGFQVQQIKRRQAEIEAVSRKFGFNSVTELEFPTTKLDVLPMSAIISAISDVAGKIKPHTVYVPNSSDIHTDHKVTFDAVMSSVKTFRCPSLRKVLAYEVLSETEFAPAIGGNVFAPNSFSDITDFFNKKLSIMKIYKSELRLHPFPRSLENIKALATFRGAMAGVRYAEAFIVLKEIW